MPQRFDLDAAAAPARRTIDAGWSPTKKSIVGAACVAGAALAIGGGAWAMLSSRPPSLPTGAEEALSVINSERFDRLDNERKEQYLAEARRLFQQMSEEERRAFMQDEKNREAMRGVGQEMMDEMARRFARGEQPQMPWGQGMRPQRPEGERRPDRPQMTEEQRAERMEQMRERIRSAFGEQVSSGNAQSGGLRGEMFKRGFGGRPGGGGRGPGGGGGGGQGGGGGGGGGAGGQPR